MTYPTRLRDVIRRRTVACALVWSLSVGSGAEDRVQRSNTLGAVGSVHCVLPDLVKYVSFHLSGNRGTSGRLLSEASVAKLHSDPDGDG